MNLDWFLLTAALCFTCYWAGKLAGMKRALRIIERSEEPWGREVGSKQELVGAIHEVVEDIQRRRKVKR